MKYPQLILNLLIKIMTMRKCSCIILLLSFLFTYSCGSEEIVIQKGDTIHKEIKLSFNNSAIEGNEYLVFKINDDFDYNNLTLLINGQETLDKTFKIYATASDVSVSIDFFLKEDAKSGNYTFSGGLKETSNELDPTYKGGTKFIPMVYKFPKSPWVIVLTYGIIGLLVLVMLFLLYKRSITFSKGTIFISEPMNENFKLKGLTKFDSKKEGCCIETGISFVFKKGKNGNPKIVSKSKDTVLYINKDISSTGKTIRSTFEVQLIKGENQINFTFI